MLSNSGHNEYGSYSGGTAGDQTGKEWQLIAWYNRPWKCILRYPDATVRSKMADLGIKAAQNDKIGYAQNRRLTYWNQLSSVGYDPSKITTACDSDCSAGVSANVKATGYILNISALKNVSASNTTSTLRSSLKNAGFTCLTDSKYLTSDNYLLAGDVLLYDGHHAAMCVGDGTLSSDEVDYTSALDEFIELAESKVGTDGTWSWSKSGLTKGQAWCAAFIDACAKQVGISGIVIAKSVYGAGSIVRQSVASGMGTFYKGPSQGGSATPQAGDLIQFRYTSVSGDQYEASHIGIVKQYVNNTIYTIQGNSGGGSNYESTVQLKNYSYNYNCISGYYRPNWSLVGSTSVTGGNLYDKYNTREDATLREVCYWNNSNTGPTTSSTNIKCSVIDYTTVLGSFFEGAIATTTYSAASSSSSSTDLSGVTNSTARTIISTMMGYGLNLAASVGICANIYHESSYNPAAKSSDGYGSVGLCQWTFSRKTAMIAYVGSNWASNVSGQLAYLWYELNTSYYKRVVLTPLQAVANTGSGARSAADTFVRKFEVPANVDKRSQERQATASTIWNQVVVQL